jgi:hypothetical protein
MRKIDFSRMIKINRINKAVEAEYPSPDRSGNPYAEPIIMGKRLKRIAGIATKK